MASIRLDQVSKSYQGRLSAMLRRPSAFWPLKDVSFSAGEGECVGVIGSNGAGKTTLLRLITGVTCPTHGKISVDGRVTALIGMENCFNRMMSAEENVRFLTSIYGLSREEEGRLMGQILEFSELGPYMKMPVRKFSSGMISRLYFSFGMHLPMDIFLLDEVMSLGDAAFQQKCVRKIEELKKAGKIILFVSHQSEEIEALCERTLWIQKGRIAADGPTRDVVPRYLEAAMYLEKSRTNRAG